MINPFVSLAWLAERLGTPEVVVLDATLPPVGVTPVPDTYARYREGHIPGAVFFDIERLSDASSGLPHTLPAAEQFAREMSALGVSDEQTIVVYEQAGVFSAPRARWMLRTFGAREVVLLDGDLAAWVHAGFPVEQGVAVRMPANFRARLHGEAVVDAGAIQEKIAGRAQIVDARSAGRFAGTLPEPRAGISSGHMPGAINLPFNELVSEGRLKAAEQLRQIFADKRVDLGQPVTTTCGSGITAAVVALGLEIAGADQVSLYDGSWAEYAQLPGVAIVKDK